jgi:uncharacterized protein (TIGR02246 family)
MMWAIALSACAQEGAQQAQEMEMSAGAMEAAAAAIDEMRGTWVQAYEAGDAATVAALYATDAVYAPASADAASGRAAIEGLLTETIAMMANRQLEVTQTDFGMSGDLSYGVGTYAMTAEVEGEPYEANGTYLVVAKRQADGTWKIQAHLSTSDQPPMMGGGTMEEGM